MSFDRTHSRSRARTPRFELYLGPMFSQKTEHLLGALYHHTLGVAFQIQPPGTEHLSSATDPRGVRLSSRTHRLTYPAETWDGIEVSRPVTVLQTLCTQPEDWCLVIDEAHFATPAALHALYTGCQTTLTQAPGRVLLGGLTTDFQGRPWNAWGMLPLLADEIHTLTARCALCAGPATRSERTQTHLTARILLKDQTDYQPLCRGCFEARNAGWSLEPPP